MTLLLPHLVLVLSAILPAVYSDDPIVRITGTDPPLDDVEGVIIQQKDKDVQLTCIVENKPKAAKVQWTIMPKNSKDENKRVVLISEHTRSMDAFRWSIDQPTIVAWRLRIQNAQVADEGTYTCRVQVVSQSYVDDSRKLKIVQKPQISELLTSSDMTKKANDEAMFECFATGRPKPVVKWSRLAGELMPNGGTEFVGNQFTIPAVQSDHAGIYKCTAYNSAGSVERKVRLTVNFRPEVYAAVPIVRQAPGYMKELVCNIKGFPQPTSNQITWRINNGPPVNIDGRYEIRNIPGAYHRITSILVINGVKREDYKSYRCEARNNIGTHHTVIELIESDVPTITRNGQIRSAASALSFSLATIIMLLTVCLCQREHH